MRPSAPLLPLNPMHTPAGMSDLFVNCGTVFRFYWWNFAFTCATIFGIGIAACTRLGLHYSRAFWVGMIATCLFMNMVACEAFLGWEKVGVGLCACMGVHARVISLNFSNCKCVEG